MEPNEYATHWDHQSRTAANVRQFSEGDVSFHRLTKTRHEFLPPAEIGNSWVGWWGQISNWLVKPASWRRTECKYKHDHQSINSWVALSNGEITLCCKSRWVAVDLRDPAVFMIRIMTSFYEAILGILCLNQFRIISDRVEKSPYLFALGRMSPSSRRLNPRSHHTPPSKQISTVASQNCSVIKENLNLDFCWLTASSIVTVSSTCWLACNKCV